uniref:Uncharacterized protein n=1 Tax=Anguilla anguilla TaxID=7936 RepID=A0A0E9PBA8_ANGAN
MNYLYLCNFKDLCIFKIVCAV